jgi:uncharacterized protein (DUF302 family)
MKHLKYGFGIEVELPFDQAQDLVTKADIDIGLLLPCNVVVRQENHSTLVSVLDPNVMSRLSEAPGLKAITDEAHQKLEWALERAFDEYIE